MVRSLALGVQIILTSGFFITEHINQGEIEGNYCPTEYMITDYFTKPLQGKHFFKFRKFVMNLKC